MYSIIKNLILNYRNEFIIPSLIHYIKKIPLLLTNQSKKIKNTVPNFISDPDMLD